MLMRSIGSTLVLSGVIASAIALAQSPDQADAPSDRAQPAKAAQPAEGGYVPKIAPSADRLYVAPPGATTYYAPQVAFSGPGAGSYVVLPQPYGVQALSPEEQQRAKEFRDAVEQLRRADSPEKKDEARKRLSEIVSAQLERDFQEREQKLAEIEARAQELRAQLEQRRSSKAEIQQTLMMMIENPETGLGLPPAWMSSLMQPSPSTTPMYGPYGPSTTVPAGSTLPPGTGLRPAYGPPTLPSSSSYPTEPAKAIGDSRTPAK